MFKYFNKRRKKGQSTLEYAILIIIILGALMSIQIYIKRGIQGRMQSAADDIGDQWKSGGMNLYKKTKTSSTTTDTFIAGVQNSILSGPETTNTYLSVNVVDRNEVDGEWGYYENIPN